MPGHRVPCCRVQLSISRVILFCCLVGSVASQTGAAQPTVAYALGLKPKQGVQYDIPDDTGAKTATLAMEKANDMTSWWWCVLLKEFCYDVLRISMVIE